MTTPTISEGDSTNAPGIYELLLDEDMSLAANNLTEHMAFYITAAGMSPVFLEVELFDPTNYTIGTVTANSDMRGTDSAATAANLVTVDTVVDAIKAKTDSLTFTTAGNVDANMVKVAGRADLAAGGSTTPGIAEP